LDESTHKPLLDVLLSYLETLGWDWPRMLIIVGVFVAICSIAFADRFRPWRERPGANRWLPRGLLLTAIGFGLVFAIAKLSISMDAGVTYRNAWNLANGRGLVYNPGIYTECYTNFLWTVMIAAWMWIGGLHPEFVSVVMSLIAFVAAVVIVADIGRRLNGRGSFYLPIAALALAVQANFTTAATTGLETMFAAMLVALGVWFVVRGGGAANAFGAGAAMILATMTRPDHSLFYVTAGVAIAFQALRSGISGEKSIGKALGAAFSFALPFLVYLAYLAWKLDYYGSIFPTTYYAKSVGMPYYSQGIVYLAVFYLYTHLWVAAAALLVYLIAPSRTGNDDATLSFKIFAGSTFVLWNVYQLRIGGDYIHGRFLVVMIPILLLAGEALAYQLARKAQVEKSRAFSPATILALVAIGLGIAAVPGSEIYQKGEARWKIFEESEMTRREPGRFFARWKEQEPFVHPLAKYVSDQGVMFAIANVGLLPYNSPIHHIDFFGCLIDEKLSRLEPRIPRQVVGHEIVATVDDLRNRNARFQLDPFFKADSHNPAYPDRTLEEVDLGLLGKHRILIYDRELMTELRRFPEVKFVDFENYLDELITKIESGEACLTAGNLAWLERIYFEHNDDSARHQPLKSAPPCGVTRTASETAH
jgi:hypothetical protein